MRTLHTQIDINAPADRVWGELTDFASFPEWNPLVLEASGELVEGAHLAIALEAGRARPFRVRPKLLRVVPGEELRWLGRLGLPGVFDGEHVFRVEAHPGGEGVTLVHEEHFRGLLVPFLWKELNTATRARFEEMNRALRDRVEARAA